MVYRAGFLVFRHFTGQISLSLNLENIVLPYYQNVSPALPDKVNPPKGRAPCSFSGKPQLTICHEEHLL